MKARVCFLPHEQVYLRFARNAIIFKHFLAHISDILANELRSLTKKEKRSLQHRLSALIDWDDPVVCHGLRHPIKYARLIRRKASSPNAQGADMQGYRYFAQLILEGKPHQKKKHTVGTEVIGLDLGPSTIAIVPREGEARLVPFCEELKPDAREASPGTQAGSATPRQQPPELR